MTKTNAKTKKANEKANATTDEVPKRLEPTKETLRELYLRSGNLCAFPGCTERILDVDGDVIGEVCHIEAAEPRGERFNKAMNNESRRAPSNLILLCRKHHKKTNNVAKYDVDALRQMKAAHEAKFSGAEDKLGASFRDLTLDARGTRAESLARMNEVLEWHYDEEQLAAARTEIAALAADLGAVPLPTRALLEVIVRRGKHEMFGLVRAHYDDLIATVGGDPQAVRTHVGILEHHGVAYEDLGDEYAWVVLYGPKSGWHIWEDLVAFAEKTGTPLSAFTQDLRFDLLD